MAYLPSRVLRHLRSLALILIASWAVVVPTGASAAAPAYVAENFAGCGGERGNGQRDAAGNLYLPCWNDVSIGRASIRIYDASGALIRTVPAPEAAGDRRYNDLAPSPDGEYLYVSSQSHNYHRLKRQGDAYVLDAGFAFEQFPYGAAQVTPMGEFLSTDGAGNVYIANGTWVAEEKFAPMTILKYDVTGRFLARFGDWDKSYDLGVLYWMITDLAVTPDGTSVYTTEVGNNRVQRWEQQFNSDHYVAKEIYGNTAADFPANDPQTEGDETRGTLCQPGKFGAPYASALDAAGNLHVVQTNCHGADGMTVQVQRLDNGMWTIIQGPKFRDAFAHGFSIDARGNIYLPSTDTLLRVTDAAPAPPVDAVAPQLTAATLPANVTARAVTLALTAADDVAVVQVRVANENGAIADAAWKPWVAQLAHELTAGDGAKVVSVQVRDAAGNLSAVLTARTTYTAPVVAPVDPPAAANQAPVLEQVTVPEKVVGNVVDVAINARDDQAVTQMRLTTEGGDWPIVNGGWQPFETITRFQLSPGAGYRGVYVQVRDAQGLESGVVYRTLKVIAGAAPVPDTAAPAIRSSTLALASVARAVTVQLDAVDNVGVTHVRMANEGQDLNAMAWRAYATQLAHELAPGDGVKTVSVQVRDAAGNQSTVATASTTLTLPVVAPPVVAPPVVAPPVVTPPVVTPPPATAPGPAPSPAPEPAPVPVIDLAPRVLSLSLPPITATRLVQVRITAQDDRRVTHLRLANEDGTWKAWRPYSPRVQWLLTPQRLVKGVFVQVRDAAGHESNVVFATTLCAPCRPASRAIGAADRGPTAAIRIRATRGSMRADQIKPSRVGQDFDLSQRDAKRDIIDCGAGADTVLKQPEDITRNCERVVTVRLPPTR